MVNLSKRASTVLTVIAAGAAVLAVLALLRHDLLAPASGEVCAFDADDPLSGMRAKDGTRRANVWTGVFPLFDTGRDGFAGTAPVGCFEPGLTGAYDMIGNAWEWTTSPFAPGGAAAGHDQGRVVSLQRGLLPTLPAGRAREPRAGFQHGSYRLTHCQGRLEPLRGASTRSLTA